MNYAASTLQKAEKTVVVDYPSGDIKIAIGKLFTVPVFHSKQSKSSNM